jgi:hypothetical protein
MTKNQSARAEAYRMAAEVAAQAANNNEVRVDAEVKRQLQQVAVRLKLRGQRMEVWAQFQAEQGHRPSN